MFSRALAAAGKIETDRYRAESLVSIAKAQIATGGLQEARETPCPGLFGGQRLVSSRPQ